MSRNYGRDLDLNLLRVFAVVAEQRSVTAAAAQLYLTQPAVSAALRRLATAVGAPLFARQGRGLALTARGQRLRAEVEAHLPALVDAALSPSRFDPRSSERTFRLGVSDTAETWILPPLLRVLERDAPRVCIISIPVQFRTVAAALSSGAVDAAITVADYLPAGVRRVALFRKGFVCLYDPRHTRIRRPLRKDDYFSRDHVVVSYNADVRGLVEDLGHGTRRVRCAVSTFANIGAVVEGSSLLATIPTMVAAQICEVRPHLRTTALPFGFRGAAMELLWPASAEDDEAGRWLRAAITQIATETANSFDRRRRQGDRRSR